MANVTVTVSQPNVTVSTANISNVSVSESTSNVVVSSVATVANGEVITGLLSVTDTGGDGSLSYASNTGVFTYTGPSPGEVRSHFSNTSPITLSAGVIGVDSAALFTGKTTDDLPQGTSNIYFSTSGAAVNSDNVPEGSSNQYFTTSRFNTNFASKSTSDLAEGTNLYFTTARSNSATEAYLAGADISLAGLTVTGNASVAKFNSNITITPVTAGANGNIVFENNATGVGSLNVIAKERPIKLITGGSAVGSGRFDLVQAEQGTDISILEYVGGTSGNLSLKTYAPHNPGAALPNSPGTFVVENVRGTISSGGGRIADPQKTLEMFKVDIENTQYNNTSGPQFRTKITGNVTLNREQNRLIQDFNTGVAPAGTSPLWTGAFQGQWSLPKANVGNINVSQGNHTNDSNTSVYDMAIVTGTSNRTGATVQGPTVYDLDSGLTYENTLYRYDIGNAFVSGKTATDVQTRWQKIWTPKQPPMEYQKVLLSEWPISSINHESTYPSHNSLYIHNDGAIFLDNNPAHGTYDGNAGIAYGGTPEGGSNKNLKLNRYITVTNPASNSGVSTNIANLNLVADRLGSTHGGVGNATIVENKGVIATLVTDYDTPIFAVEKRSGSLGIRSNTVSRPFKVDAGGNATIGRNLVAGANATSVHALTGNLNITGNITASGNINYQNVTDLYVTDQKITLNANAATDATVEIIANRPVAGSSTLVRWNETSDVWQFTNDGSTFYNIPASTTDLAEGTNLYYTDGRFDTRLGTKSTTDLTEGTNLYYTTTRSNADFDTRLGTKTTSDLSEGTNLYYTTARANLAIQSYQGTINTPGTIDSGGITTNQLISNNVIKTNKIQSFDTTGGIYINDNGGVNHAPIINIALRSKNDSNVAITEGFKIQGSTLANGQPGVGNLSDLMIVNPLGGVDFRLDQGSANVSDGGDFKVHSSGTGSNTFVVKRSGNVDIKQQLNLTGPTNSDSNLTTTANISGNVITATTGLISNKVESTASSNISLDTNTKAVKILKDFASVTSQDTLILDSDGYRPLNWKTAYPSYSGSGLRRNTLHQGTATAGSPVVTVTESAVNFWYGTPTAGQRTDAFANIAANCMFVTKATNAGTGNSTTSPFPIGTRILSVDPSAFTITMTQNATADATFSQADGTGLFTGDGAYDTNQPYGELYVTNADWNGGSDQSIEFAVFTGSTDNLSYGVDGPQDADLTTSVASGTITNGDYYTSQRSKVTTNLGYTASKNGFTVGDGATLSSRFENDNFATKGINIVHDGEATFSTEFGSSSWNSQYGIKQYTESTLQNSFPTQGPRLLLSSAKGKISDDPFNTYPRSGQSLGQIAWQATTGKSLTPSSLRVPVYINAIASEDHSLGSNTNVYFGVTSNSDNQSVSNKAHIYLASQDGKTIIAAGEKGTTKEDIYFAPALQPNPGYSIPTTYDFSTVAGQKSWAKMNYANTSATSGAQLTVTHGQSAGAGTVGDQVVKLARNDNSYSLTGQVINADNTPNNVFGAGVVGNTYDSIGSLTGSGNYVDGTAAVISGFTGSPYAALNGTTKYLKFFGQFGSIAVYELYDDAGLTTGFASGIAAGSAQNLGPGVFTYTATQSSGVTAKSYSLELEEQSNVLKIKEDAAVRLSIDTTETELFNRLQLYSLTTTEINALASPQAGQVVYNSTLNQMCLYNGSAWQKITQATM